MGEKPEFKDHSVLIVDDNLDGLEATAYLIEAAFGCTTLTASSAQQALALIDEGARIDVLFADVVMPETDGLTLATLAKARMPDLHVVLVTGWHGEIDAIIAKGYVALLKPYSVEHLGAILTELFDPSATGVAGRINR